MWEASTKSGSCTPEQKGNFTIHQMVESSISGAAYKGNSGIDPDFLLPPSVRGTGQYPICNFFGDLTVYQSGSNDSIH